MKKLLLLVVLLLSSATTLLAQDDKFRRDYNYVSLYDSDTKEWGDWKPGYNTFVFNYNANNDILHIKANGNKVVYRKLSGVEEGTTSDGKHYQIVRALDEDGDAFRLQIFDDSEAGAKMIYANFMIQFSNH